MPLKLKNIVAILAFGSIGLGCISAVAQESSFTKDWPAERAFINGINLSTDKFITAYASQNPADRRYAEVYLLGVLDATEGVVWCSYRQFKTGTLEETIFTYLLREMPESEKQQRASKVISSVLGRRYPCHGARK